MRPQPGGSAAPASMLNLMSSPSLIELDQRIISAARAVCSLAPAVSGRDQMLIEIEDARRAAKRGYFTADEDERVRTRFSQYLTARAGLWQTIAELEPVALRQAAADEATQLRAFVVAYAAACLLVRSGRVLVRELAADPLVQRKLNEAEPRYGIPRKQFTSVYRSLTGPMNAWRLHEARQLAAAHRNDIDAMAADPELGPVVAHLRQAEEAINVPVKRYLLARLRFRLHSFRLRRASALARTMEAMLEFGGRIVADIRNPWHEHRVTPEVRAQFESLLQPGDVIVSRHDDALSNLFLPGFWPHASLHIGPERVRHVLPVRVDPPRAARWVDPIRTLEARKDGVRFRALDDTLGVDAVAVIRPRIGSREVADAISRAVEHEGKLYNFDLDFFRSDVLACTGVIHRAYDGIGGLRFDLKWRAGRLTLSAEDVLDLAVEDRGFEAVAVYGVPGLGGGLISGPAALDALKASYRPPG
jgi:hypothetical protein